jgi:hypothetical protein
MHKNPAIHCGAGMGSLSTNVRTHQSPEICLSALIEQLRQVEHPGGLFSASAAWKNDWDAFCHANHRQKWWTIVCFLMQSGVPGPVRQSAVQRTSTTATNDGPVINWMRRRAILDLCCSIFQKAAHRDSATDYSTRRDMHCSSKNCLPGSMFTC